MYVEERNGKYRFGEWYTEYRTGKRKRVTVTFEKNTAPIRREAQRILDEKIREANMIVDPSTMTLQKAADAYMEYQQNTVKASTARRNSYAIKIICNYLGPDTLLASLNAGHIKRAMLNSGRPKKTLNEDITRMKAWIRWCYKNDYVESVAYLDKIEKFKVPSQPVKEKYLERDELQRLLPELKVEINRLMIEFLALSGLRIGEAVALEWRDIDGKTIHVNKTYDSNNRITTSTKTDASCRDLFIQSELADVIRRLRLYYMKYGIRSKYVFANYDGKMVTVNSIEKYFRENTERVLGKKMRVHSLRHTHASLLFEQGMSLEAVSLRLGHANSRITKDIYLHITEKKKEEYNAQLEKISLLG